MDAISKPSLRDGFRKNGKNVIFLDDTEMNPPLPTPGQFPDVECACVASTPFHQEEFLPRLCNERKAIYRNFAFELIPQPLKGHNMPTQTPCTKCGHLGADKYCGACGANQSIRFPEMELVEFMLSRYAATKKAVDAIPDGETTTKGQLRAIARHVLNTSRLRTLHALCAKVDHAFALPTEFEGAPIDETPPNEEP